MWRKENPRALLLRMRIGAATVGNSMEVPKKLKIKYPYDPAVPFLGIYPQKTKTLIQKGVFMAALFTTAKI